MWEESQSLQRCLIDKHTIAIPPVPVGMCSGCKSEVFGDWGHKQRLQMKRVKEGLRNFREKMMASTFNL